MKRPGSTHLMIWITGCTLVAFAVLNAANYYWLSQKYYDRIARENRIHTENIAFGVTGFFETVYKIVGEMARDQEVRGNDYELQYEYLRDRFSQHDFFDNLAVQRVPDGFQTARVKGVAAQRPDRWWFRQILQEKRPFISHSFYSFGFDANIPTTVTGIFYPVLQDHEMVSVFAAFLRVEEVQNRVASHYRGDDRYTYVLDEEGTVIVHPDWGAVREHHNFKTGKKALVAKPRLSGQDYELVYQDINIPAGLKLAAAQVLNGETGTTEYTDDAGRAIICSYVPVRMPGYDASWGAITLQEKSVAMAPLREAAGANAVFSFFVFAGLAVLLLRQSRELEKGARELVLANESLETEVAERTKAEMELTATNEELTAMNEEMVSVTNELQNVNHQMATEIGRRQLTEEKLKLRERQTHAVTRLLTDSNADIGVQLEAILDSALQLVGSFDGYIALLEKGMSKVSYARGSRTELLGKSLTVDVGLYPAVLSTGRLQYVEDYQNYPERRPGEHWLKVSTAVLLPMKKGEEMIGVLSVIWQGEIHPLKADELDMLQQFADLVSLALQGSSMREELQRDLLQQKILHEKISHMAYHDILTGLPNRAFLKERLDAELVKVADGKSAGSLFYIDLDDLKSINDNFGHPSGDRMIIDAGRKMKEAAGKTAFVARLGGDEFIILLPDQDNTVEIAAMADRLIDCLSEEYPIAGKSVHVSASIGIVVFPGDGYSAEELMKKVDNAMYAAKKAGRNCWRFFEPMMLLEAQEKMLLTQSLRRALGKNELKVVYQPQVRVDNGRVVCFEALLRWHSAEHGMVSPARFIPLAENSQLIVPIGEWVLQEACGFARELSRLGYSDVSVAVNLSPKQLADDRLIEFIKQSVLTYGIEPQRLELEITETALMTSLEDGGRKLASLDELGVRIALDDFGTGYSSLTYLRLFPVTTLKIDKSFIDSLPDAEGFLVRSLIQFAQNLQMSVVAEGVERTEQYDYLTACGCDLVQGYLVSRPVAPEEAVRFLTERNERKG